ncbi:MAG: nucleotide exchange factor GrpE [Vigna little leaf phytoplasma]|nr:nucleotide exchange factor GrpE [Vigna little leaf phytoplasma]
MYKNDKKIIKKQKEQFEEGNNNISQKNICECCECDQECFQNCSISNNKENVSSNDQEKTDNYESCKCDKDFNISNDQDNSSSNDQEKTDNYESCKCDKDCNISNDQDNSSSNDKEKTDNDLKKNFHNDNFDQKLSKKKDNVIENSKEILQEEINKQVAIERLKYQAELDNFNKRIQKEKDTALKYASMDLIRELLSPLEQFEKVLEIPTEDPLLQKFLSGFKMIQQQIKEILEKEGVKEIKTLGEPFNPDFHYAVDKESDFNKPNGINLAVLQKGFLYKDLVLKPSMVKINEWSENNENK